MDSSTRAEPGTVSRAGGAAVRALLRATLGSRAPDGLIALWRDMALDPAEHDARDLGCSLGSPRSRAGTTHSRSRSRLTRTTPLITMHRYRLLHCDSMIRSTLTRRWQTTIPAEVRRAFALAPRAEAGLRDSGGNGGHPPGRGIADGAARRLGGRGAGRQQGAGTSGGSGIDGRGRGPDASAGSVTRYLLDANLVLRFLRDDHPALSPRATALFASASRGDCALVLPSVVVAECVWVLRSFYDVSHARIAANADIAGDPTRHHRRRDRRADRCARSDGAHTPRLQSIATLPARGAGADEIIASFESKTSASSTTSGRWPPE